MAPPRWTIAAVLMATVTGCLASPATAQPRPHYRHHANMPPGAIGQGRLQRGGPLRGYYQPVEITSSSGANVALATAGGFDGPSPGILGGFLIGGVYRLKVTGIPLHEGREVYPTLEVIDRTWPPPGREWHFPIVVDIDKADLDLALEGKLVTRVIYLEDPRNAIPARRDDRFQDWFDVRPGQDPLFVADALGRPVAILRMGGRVPMNFARPNPAFLYGSPSWLKVNEKRQMEQR